MDYTAPELTDTTNPLVITIPDHQQAGHGDVHPRPARRPGGRGSRDHPHRRHGGGRFSNITTVNHQDIRITDDETSSEQVALTRSSGLDSFTEDHGAGVPYTVVATLAGGIARSVETPMTLSFGGDAALGADCSTAGVDYTVSPSPAMVTIAAEATTGSATVTLTPCDDSVPELAKTIAIGGTADFGGATGVPVTSGFSVSLVDDDLPIITLSLERVTPAGDPDESVAEGSSGTFRITASRETSRSIQPVKVDLSVLDSSTAQSPADYTQLSLGSITIGQNDPSASRTVTVRTRQDELVEDGETIVIGGQVGDGTEFHGGAGDSDHHRRRLPVHPGRSDGEPAEPGRECRRDAGDGDGEARRRPGARCRRGGGARGGRHGQHGR